MATINPITQAAAAAEASSKAGAEKIQEISSEQSDVSMAIMDIVRQRSAQEVLVQETADLAKLQTQKAKLKVGEIQGTNVLSSTEKMSALADQASKAYEESLAAEKVIAEKESVNFFDNPLGWLEARFTINQDIAQFNSAVTRQAAAEKRQSELNAATAAGIQNQNAFEQTLTAAAIAAKSESIRQGAEIQAQQAMQQALGYNIRGVEAAMKASLDTLQIRTSVYHAQMQQESQKIALANLALAQEQFKWRKEEKESQEDFDSRLVATYNKGQQILQGPKATLIDPSSKEAKFVAQMLKSNTEAGKEYQRTYFAGQSGIVAPTVSKVIEAITSGSGVYFSPSQGKLKDLIGKVEQATVANQSLDKKDPKAVAEFQTAEVRRLLDKELSNIVVGSGSLFDPPSMDRIIKLDPQLQALPVTQKVLMPLMASGATLTPERSIPAIAQAISEGKLTFEQGRQAASIFQRQVVANAEDKQLIKFGLVPGKETVTSFKTEIVVDPTGIFGGKKVINIANPVELGEAMMKYNTKVQIANRFSGVSASNNINMGMEDVSTMFQKKPTGIGDSAEYSGGTPDIYNTNPDYWKNVRGAK